MMFAGAPICIFGVSPQYLAPIKQAKVIEL
jgi:hypothetical protein